MRVAGVFLLLQLLLPAAAQDPSRRMDPDVWFQLPEVTAGFEILRGLDSCYAADVKFDRGLLHMISGSQGEFFTRSGDMRLVLDSSGASVSRSHNIGFNLGSRQFYWANRYFAVGGRGFWNRHSKLVEFVGSTGEWELQPCVDAPRHVMGTGSFFDAAGERIVSLDPNDFLSDPSGQCRLVHALDLRQFKWEQLGELNPILDIYFQDGSAVALDLENFFVWAGLHKAVVLRKSDLKVVVTSAFNRPMMSKGISDLVNPGPYTCTSSVNGHYRVSKREQDGTNEQWALDWDVQGVFLANEMDALPFYVPKALETDKEELAAEREGGLWWIIALLVGVAFFAGRRTTAKVGAISTSESDIPGETTSLEVGLSPLVRKFLDCGLDKLDTDSLNRLLGLEMEQSQETKRARRAQAVRLVNQEYKMRYGVDLIHRNRDEIDRRRTTYVIKRHSDTA